jgi:hypothetical protein
MDEWRGHQLTIQRGGKFHLGGFALPILNKGSKRRAPTITHRNGYQSGIYSREL